MPSLQHGTLRSHVCSTHYIPWVQVLACPDLTPLLEKRVKLARSAVLHWEVTRRVTEACYQDLPSTQNRQSMMQAIRYHEMCKAVYDSLVKPRQELMQ